MEIKLKNLTKVFPGNPAKNIPDAVAVDSLNVDIRDGELIGLLQPCEHEEVRLCLVNKRHENVYHPNNDYQNEDNLPIGYFLIIFIAHTAYYYLLCFCLS